MKIISFKYFRESSHLHFSIFFFLTNIGQENVFYDIPEQKNAFLGNNKKEVQKDKKVKFFRKGLTHGCGPKMAILGTFFPKAI